MTRYQIALGSYWLLFVIVPVLLIGIFLGISWVLGAFAVLVLIGEHIFRLWKRVCNVKIDVRE